MNQLEQLPDELIYHLLLILPITDIISLTELNLRMNLICQDTLLWQQLFKREYPHLLINDHDTNWKQAFINPERFWFTQFSNKYSNFIFDFNCPPSKNWQQSFLDPKTEDQLKYQCRHIMGGFDWYLDFIPITPFLEQGLIYYLKGPITLIVPLNKLNRINKKITINKTLICKKDLAETLVNFYLQTIPSTEIQELINDPIIKIELNWVDNPKYINCLGEHILFKYLTCLEPSVYQVNIGKPLW